MNAVEHIFLIGFLESGNIPLGKRLAEAIRLPFVDSNALLATIANTDIIELYRTRTLEELTKLQHQTFQQIVTNPPAVVAITDVVPLQEADCRLFSQCGKTIYIQRTAERLYWRLRHDEKQPALFGTREEARHKRISALLAEREPTYLKADFVVPCEHEQISDLVSVIKSWILTQTPGSVLATAYYRKEAKT